MNASMVDLIPKAEGTVTTKGARGSVRFANQADSIQADNEALYQYMGNPSDADLHKDIDSSQSYRFLQDQYASAPKSNKDIAAATFGINNNTTIASPTNALL